MPSLLEYYTPHVPESGCDEAGRGCLAGPVVASAVILHQGWNHPLLNDSKKLSHASRALLREVIEREAAHWAVGWVWPDEIDRINILNASFLAMHRALDQLAERPGHILVDGNRFTPYGKIPHICVVKGDGKYRSIAAASILAKTHRDAYMEGLHHQFPTYAWNQNKGYPTAAHRAAIASFGSCAHHRQSFTLMPKQLEFFAEEA